LQNFEVDNHNEVANYIIKSKTILLYIIKIIKNDHPHSYNNNCDSDTKE